MIAILMFNLWKILLFVSRKETKKMWQFILRAKLQAFVEFLIKFVIKKMSKQVNINIIEYIVV